MFGVTFKLPAVLAVVLTLHGVLFLCGCTVTQRDVLSTIHKIQGCHGDPQNDDVTSASCHHLHYVEFPVSFIQVVNNASKWKQCQRNSTETCATSTHREATQYLSHTLVPPSSSLRLGAIYSFSSTSSSSLEPMSISGKTSSTPPLTRGTSTSYPLTLPSNCAIGSSIALKDGQQKTSSAPIFRTKEPESFAFVTSPPSLPVGGKKARAPLVLTSSEGPSEEHSSRDFLRDHTGLYLSSISSIPPPKTQLRTATLLKEHQPISWRRIPVTQSFIQTQSSITSWGFTSQNFTSFPSPSVTVSETVAVLSLLTSQRHHLSHYIGGSAIPSRSLHWLDTLPTASLHDRVPKFSSFTMITPSSTLDRHRLYTHIATKAAQSLEKDEEHRTALTESQGISDSTKWLPYHNNSMGRDREHFVKLLSDNVSQLQRITNSPTFIENLLEFKTRAGTHFMNRHEDRSCRTCATERYKTRNPTIMILTSSQPIFPEPKTRSALPQATNISKNVSANTFPNVITRKTRSLKIPITLPPADVPEPSTIFPSIRYKTSCVIETKKSVYKFSPDYEILSSASPSWFPEPQTIVRYNLEGETYSSELSHSLILQSSLRAYPDVTFWNQEIVTPMTTV